MRYRTFIAVDVSPFSRDRLRGLQEQLAPIVAGVKWVETTNLHMTLVFLGEVNEREVVGVCRATETVAASFWPFSFTLDGLGAFPTARRPKTLIAKVGEGADVLSQLHTAIEPALTDLGCYRREERAFTPHVTVGRVGRDATGDLPAAIQKFSAWQGGESKVHELRIMASELGSDGPVYTLLGRAKLSGRPSKAR